MAENQEIKRYRVLNLPSSGLVSGTNYELYLGGGQYRNYVVNDSNQLVAQDGKEFIECDTVDDLRNLDARQIWAIQNGYYKGVTLSGYYTKGDTPAPIDYYLSDTMESDDGGSVFEVGGVKLEHDFEGVINPLYYGVGDGELYPKQINKAEFYEITSELDLGNRAIELQDGSTIDFTKGGGMSGYTWNQGFLSRNLEGVKVKGYNKGDVKFPSTAYINDESVYVNALTIGFKNDGVTDNSSIMNSFLSSANSGIFNGNTVLFFPQGYYLFENPISLTSNTGSRRVTFLGCCSAYTSNFNIQNINDTVNTSNDYLGRYLPQASVLIFKNTNNLHNITFLDIYGAYYKNLIICATSGDVEAPLVFTDRSDSPKPSPYRVVDVDENHIINGVRLSYHSQMDNCCVEGFSGWAIMNNFSHLRLNSVRVTRSGTAIEVDSTRGFDAIYDTVYITLCQIGIVLNEGYNMLYNLWIDEVSKNYIYI